MYFDRRLFGMTRGVRGRMALAALVGLIAVPVAMWRLALTGQAMARVFTGEPFDALVGVLVLIGWPDRAARGCCSSPATRSPTPRPR